jgi:hypothetical protein
MNQLDVDTPIGTLHFYADAAEGDIGDVNLTCCEIAPNIPKGMSVDGCKAVLLRCTPNTSIKDFIFSCSWKDLSELTLHYIISWNSIPETVEGSCWYAVDVSHNRVLIECN